MDTLHSVLNRGCSIWDRDLLPENQFERRIEQVRQGMKDRGLDLLLVYGDSWKFGNLAFVSHFMPKNRGAMAVVPAAGSPALIVQEPDRNNPFSRTMTWIEEVHSTGQFAQGLARALEAKGLKAKRVGLASVEQQLGARQWELLFKGLEGVATVDCTAFMQSLRYSKTECEIGLIERSARLLREAVSLLRRDLAPNVTEYAMMGMAERVVRSQGAEEFRFLLARASDPELGLRPPEARSIADGEGLLILMAASYQRHWAELGQTFVLGGASDKLLQGHRFAADVVRRMAKEIHPGTKPGAISSLLVEFLPSETARRCVLAYGLGNGVGLELDEEPFFGASGGPEIAPGMTLTLRACVQDPNLGSGLVSRPFKVGVSSLEPLTDLESEIIVCGR